MGLPRRLPVRASRPTIAYSAAITLPLVVGTTLWSVAVPPVLALSAGGLAALLATAVVLLARGGKAQTGQPPPELMAAIVAVADGCLAVTEEDRQLCWHNAGYARLFPDGIAGPPERLLAEDDCKGATRKRFCLQLKERALARGVFAAAHPEHGRWLQIEARKAGAYTVWVVQAVDEAQLLAGVLADAKTRSGPLLERIGLGLIVADTEGDVRYISRAVSAWTEQIMDEEPILLDRLLTGQGRRLRCADGSLIAVESVVEPLRHHGQVTLGHAAVVRNLALERERYGPKTSLFEEALIEQAPLGVALIGRSGSLRGFNKAMLSFAPARRLRPGDSLATLVHEDDRPIFARTLAATFDEQKAQPPVELRFNTQPERAGQLLLSPGGVPGADAAAVYLLDLTQQKSLERQFTQAQKMQAVGQLAGGIAHDFNNLLTAIIGFCDLLLVRHSANDEAFTDVMQIKQNANRAANLVRQLLAFSRQQTLRPKILSITDVLAELSNLLRRLIGENIELRMVHGRDLGAIKVDQGQLEQVIINLAVNARDAMPDGGVLTIASRPVAANDPDIDRYDVMPAQDYVLVECKDTGVGIPAENLNKIFDPFFTTKEIGQGTGLGLSTVYGIIKQTGGFVFVDSEPGQGACFKIYLPVHQVAGHEVAVEEAPAPMRDLTGKGTILLVEDEDAVRMFASRALSNKGYTVLEAGTGEEALECISGHCGPVDLLISDVVMPGMDGPTLVAHARQGQPDLRVIFISGYAEDAVRESLGGEGFDFLPKPFTLKQLAEKVKSSLG